MTTRLDIARALLEQHDVEAARGQVSPTQLGLADLVRDVLREIQRLRDENSEVGVEGALVCCDVCERALVIVAPARSDGKCRVCGRAAGHGPLSDEDERLPS